MLKTALEWENLRFIKLQREPSGGTPKRKAVGSNPAEDATSSQTFARLRHFLCIENAAKHALLLLLSPTRLYLAGDPAYAVFDEFSSKAAFLFLRLSIIHIVLTKVCGSLPCDSKISEPKIFRKLVDVLDISGAMLVADALHCQKESAEKVVAEGGDYLFVAKENQPTLHEEIELYFQDEETENYLVFTQNLGYTRLN